MSIAQNIGTGTFGIGFSTITLKANYNFGEEDATAVDYVLTNNNSPLTSQAINLVTGNNTINATVCPALPQAGGVFIIPPTGNGALLTLKGATGDTGIVLNLTAPTFIPFNVSPPASFVISAASSVTGLVLAWV